MPVPFTLDPTEARIFGVLVEKDLTTPDQYPLSLNALVNGCNQKSNRHPVTSLDKDTVMDAILKLRVAQLVDFVIRDGSRVEHYSHRALSTLGLAGAQLAVFTELLLRGPQSAGDLRARAARMSPIPTKADLDAALAPLMEREFVVRLPPAPGSRATQYAQRLSPDSHPVDTSAAASASTPASTPAPTPAPAPAAPRPTAADPALADRVTALEAEVRHLAARLDEVQGGPSPS